MFLSRFASRVTILIRADSLHKSMSQYLIDQIERTENISLEINTEVAAVAGSERLESITMKNNITGETETAPADAIFLFIGAVPHSDIVAGIVERTEAGFIPTGPDLIRDGRRPKNWKLRRDPFLLETSVPWRSTSCTSTSKPSNLIGGHNPNSRPEKCNRYCVPQLHPSRPAWPQGACASPASQTSGKKPL